MKITRRKRGAMLLGLSALILTSTFLTWAMIQRSFDTYLVSSQAEAHLQALAAAEGTIVWLEGGRDLPEGGLEVGPCRVMPGMTRDNGINIVVDVYRTNPDLPVMSRNFVLIGPSDEGQWRLEVGS